MHLLINCKEYIDIEIYFFDVLKYICSVLLNLLFLILQKLYCVI